MWLIGNKGFAALFLLSFSFGVYAFSLKSEFVWDDVEVLEKSSFSIKSWQIKSILIPSINKRQNVATYYRPLIFLSNLLDRSLWGISTFGFHLSNVIFNSFSTVAFYFLVWLVFKEFGVDRREIKAFFSSILFALHPMHVESVSWIAGRTDVLCGLFFFLAFIFHVLSDRNSWFLIVGAFTFYLSLLSKEVAVAFPIVALGFDLLSHKLLNRKSALKYMVYMLLVFIYFYIRGRALISIPDVVSQFVPSHTHQGFQILDNLKIVLNSYTIYLNKLVFPFEFNAYIVSVPKDSYYFISSIIVILLLLIIGVISIRRRERVGAFSIFWIIVTLAPSSIIAIFVISQAPVAERYLYIPSAGYCLLIGYLISEFGERKGAENLAWTIGILLCLSYLFFTIERQSVWKSDLTLWEDTSKKSFFHGVPHSNYGYALMNAGRVDEAIKELLVALSPEVINNNRGRADASNNIGIAYSYKKDYKNAEKWFIKALSYDPNYGRAYYHLGLIYLIKGENENFASDFRIAEGYLKKSLDLYYCYGRAFLILAKVNIGLGEEEKAKENAERAIKCGLIESLNKEAQGILDELKDK